MVKVVIENHQPIDAVMLDFQLDSRLGFGLLDCRSRRNFTSPILGVVRRSRSPFGVGFLRRSTAYIPIGVPARPYRLLPCNRPSTVHVSVRGNDRLK